MATKFNYIIDDTIAVVTFNDEQAPVNTWSVESEIAFEEMVKNLDSKAKSGEVKGVIIISGKENTFLTGADLNGLIKSTTKEDFDKDIRLLQGILNDLEALPVPTVAAIDGHTMGGGCELVLACTARIAKDTKNTLIGLPETGLGLIPGGGGTVRLPRLIGYAGLEAILAAKPFPAKQALEIGLIDKLVDADANLLEEAKKYIKGMISGEIKPERKVHDFSDVEQKVDEIKKNHIKRNRGRLLPAPEAAMNVVAKGINLPIKEQLDIEREEFVEVAVGKEARGSLHTFFLNSDSNAKKLLPKGFVPREIKKIGVLGFGSMGRGIIIDCLKSLNAQVVVKDVEPALEPGKAFVAKIIGGDIAKGRYKGDLEKVMSKLTLSDSYKGFEDVDLVIEAVFEDKKVKVQVYKELCEVIKSDTIIASNTSFLSINELQKNVVNPERFAGMHFFSPVWRMKLVEVIKGADSSDDTINNLVAFCGGIRKKPILCTDSPGFIVNAVLDPLMTNGIALVEQGNPIDKVDNAMLKFGMPVGPLRLVDEVGLDVSYHIFKERGIEQKSFDNFYAEGRNGLKKSGKGLFLEDGSVDPGAMESIVKGEENIMTEEEIVNFFITDMVTVAKKLLDEKIVEDPKYIDIGMIWGTGFPSDKGGPVKWADLAGLSEKLFGEKFYK